MRVHFVNRFYWPAEPATAQLLTDLAEGLVGRGWEVSVVTGHSSGGLPALETRRGVAIHRVGPAMTRTQSLARRAVDFLAFHVAAGRHLRHRTRRGDIVVALTDPPLLGVTVQRAAYARGVRTVHWIHDIYPELLPAVSRRPGSTFMVDALRPARDRAWRHAGACVTLGTEMAAFVASTGVASPRIHVVPNWAPKGIMPASDDAVAALRREWNLTGKFVVAYSGNLGRVHDVTALFGAADRLRDDDRFVFLFLGGGAGFDRLRQEVVRQRLTHVRLLEAQPRSALATSLSLPDVHVVSLRDGCESLVFPSKLYGIAAAGRPVLALAPQECEVARLVTAHGLGMAFSPRDDAGVADGLRTLAGQPAQLQTCAAASAQFGRTHAQWQPAIAAWDELLRKLDAAP
jgi:colanic acid biosynthesis glycosyl transferase WcaI